VSAPRDEPRAAATVMLLRDAPGGLEVFLTRRSARSAFVPDTFVFPGGAVEPNDAAPGMLARLHGADARVTAETSVAALRELFEEAGVLLACDETGDALALDARHLVELRAEMTAGTPLEALLARNRWLLDARDLAYYSNWITPRGETRRFDAHFFIAALPPGQQAAADAVEVHDGIWLAPREALERADDGRLPIIFPTRKHLERLRAHATLAAALADARLRTIVAVHPVIDERGEPCLPDELAAW
jgi:8-oxo-dGTP pyrophosphatase MutT (NUDIX family)